MTEKYKTSYINLLEDEFLSRKNKNHRYSLRSFASQLDLSPTYLSLIFHRKRNLSPSTAHEVAQKLKWASQKRKYFVCLLEFENSKSEFDRETALHKLQKLESSQLDFNVLQVDTFAAISVWYHNAILILLTLPLKATVTMIASRLSLTAHEVKTALIRLERLGLVKEKKNFWTPTNSFLKVESSPSAAIKSYHKQVLTKAAEALDQQDFNERDFSNMTLVVDPKKFKEAKLKIIEFQSEMANLLQGQSPTEVYQFSIQLFRLTRS